MTNKELKFQEKFKHIQNLAALFNIPESSAITLYSKLRRLELKLNRIFLTACERSLTDKEESSKQSAKKKVKELTGNITGLYINSDPRGYAIKIDDAICRNIRNEKGINLYSDWGGYGILAPDFN